MGRKRKEDREETSPPLDVSVDPILDGKDYLKSKKIYLTKTEQRIMDALSDGKPHTTGELVKCLFDTLSSEHAVEEHIKNIRKKLDGTRHWIVREKVKGKFYYRRIITFHKSNT